MRPSERVRSCARPFFFFGVDVLQVAAPWQRSFGRGFIVQHHVHGPAASVGVAGLRPGGVRRRMFRALLLEAGRVCRVVGGCRLFGLVGCRALFDLVGRGSIHTESVQLDASAVRCYLKPIVFVGRGWV